MSKDVNFDLTGKIVLVTGGTKGIGYGIVRQMLQAGAKVALTSRTAAECTEIAANLNAESPGDEDRAVGIACDLSDISALQPLVCAVLARWGQIDALVCNAADTGEATTIDDASLERFEDVLKTNIVNNFALARSVAQPMLERGDGSIIFITSIAASTPMPSNVAYAAAKSGLASLASSLATEYARRGVRVNCVAPGLVRSHSSRVIWENEDIARSFIGRLIPMQRIGEAEEIGAVCVFLASSASAYITAANIPVDGGRAGISAVTGGPELLGEKIAEA